MAGYKMHATETYYTGSLRVITYVETTPGTTRDHEVTNTIHAALAAKTLLPINHWMDAGMWLRACW